MHLRSDGGHAIVQQSVEQPCHQHDADCRLCPEALSTWACDGDVSSTVQQRVRGIIIGGGGIPDTGLQRYFSRQPWEGGGYEKFFLTHLPKISFKQSHFKVEGWFTHNNL